MSISKRNNSKTIVSKFMLKNKGHSNECAIRISGNSICTNDFLLSVEMLLEKGTYLIV